MVQACHSIPTNRLAPPSWIFLFTIILAGYHYTEVPQVRSQYYYLQEIPAPGTQKGSSTSEPREEGGSLPVTVLLLSKVTEIEH